VQAISALLQILAAVYSRRAACWAVTQQSAFSGAFTSVASRAIESLLSGRFLQKLPPRDRKFSKRKRDRHETSEFHDRLPGRLASRCQNVQSAQAAKLFAARADNLARRAAGDTPPNEGCVAGPGIFR
jgi:hypothetical protein